METSYYDQLPASITVNGIRLSMEITKIDLHDAYFIEHPEVDKSAGTIMTCVAYVPMDNNELDITTLSECVEEKDLNLEIACKKALERLNQIRTMMQK